jgi:hypothetical protein
MSPEIAASVGEPDSKIPIPKARPSVELQNVNNNAWSWRSGGALLLAWLVPSHLSAIHHKKLEASMGTRVKRIRHGLAHSFHSHPTPSHPSCILQQRPLDQPRPSRWCRLPAIWLAVSARSVAFSSLQLQIVFVKIIVMLYVICSGLF